MVEKKEHFVFSAALVPEDGWYVAHCLELGVVSQGRTIKEALKNLKEATELYIEEFPVTKEKKSHAIMTTYEVIKA